MIQFLLALFLGLGAMQPTSAEGGFAPTDLGSEISLARHLASQANFEEAIDLLASSLELHPEDPAAALGAQDLRLLKDAIALRESHLAGLAKNGGKLRINVDGKRRSLRVAGFENGLVTFAVNRYKVTEIGAGEIEMDDLAASWKNAKAGTPEVRAYTLRLIGDKSWKTQWGSDNEGHEGLIEDFIKIPDSVLQGKRVLTLRKLEAYSGRELGRGEGRTVIVLFEETFSETLPDLKDDQRNNLRALLRTALVSSWGLEELATGLNASEYQVIGEELKLTYNFDDEKEMADWPRDESKLFALGRLGILRTPKDEWTLGLSDGFLQVLGTRNIRHIVPFKGPLHVRYPVQVPSVGKPGGLWLCGVYLHDDLDKSFMSVFGMGYLLQSSERGRPKEVKRDQLYYEVGKNYYVDLLYDKTGVLTVVREDKPKETLLTIKTRKVDRGFVSFAATTDYLTRYDSIEIQGKPDLAQMDRFRADWVIERLATLGY